MRVFAEAQACFPIEAYVENNKTTLEAKMRSAFLRIPMWCAMAKAMLIVLGVCLAPVKSSSASEEAWIHPGWEQVPVDFAPLAGTLRRQIADVSMLGGRRFVVAYVVEDLTDGTLGRGDLRFARFDVDAGVKSAPIAAAVRGDWVRAATGGPLLQGTCIFEAVMARFVPSEMQVEFGNPNFVAFFSYGLEGADGPRAKLVRHTWCGGRFMTSHHDVGVGAKPSTAVGRFAGEIKLLVVYGRSNAPFGRFFDTAGTAIGAEFTIGTFPAGFAVASTDIVWNAVAERFIVGFLRNGGVGGGCTVNNVRVTWQGVAEEPVERGFCDPETGGHHTAVGYDNRPFANPDGVYAWWYEGHPENGGQLPEKGLRLMDASGNPTGLRADAAQGALTLPVAARREKSSQLQPLSNLIPGSYVTASTVSLMSPGEKRMAGSTFDSEGSTRMIGLVAPEHSQPVAVETLETDTVLLWRQCMSVNSGVTCSLTRPMITVFSHFRPDQVVLRIKGARDAVEKSP